MGHTQNFDKQNFDKLIVGSIGETLRGKVNREKLMNHQPLIFCQIAKVFHHQNLWISTKQSYNMEPRRLFNMSIYPIRKNHTHNQNY